MVFLRRRIVLAALGVPLVALGQPQSKIWRVGFLALRHVSFNESDFYYIPFREALRDIGYVEGRNVTIEWRSAEGREERLPKLAAELVHMNVDVIVVGGTQATAAAQAATTTIPIVMGGTGDPAGSGFVKSFAHPSGNITGLSTPSSATAPKRLQILASIVPSLHSVAVLMNPSNQANAGFLRSVQTAAKKTGIEIIVFEVRTPREIEAAFPQMAAQHADAVLVASDAMLSTNARRIAQLALQNRLPSAFPVRRDVDLGGLVSYGPNVYENYRRAAIYVDKILKGAKPADLPVDETTSFEVAVNRKTAKALRLTLPPELITVATRVVD